MDFEPKPEKKNFLEGIMKAISNLTLQDKVAIFALLAFIVLVSIPVYAPKGDCEIARPGYTCASSIDVMIENCNYWSQWSCDSSQDISLPQVEWYIDNLCDLASKRQSLDCSNLKLACNQVTGENICSV